MNAETIVMNQIREKLSSRGIVLRMNVGNFKLDDGRQVKCGIPGMSDLLFIGNGYIAWMEVKTKTGVASANQTNFIRIMQKMGHRAGIVRSVEEAENLINGEIEDGMTI